MGTTVLQYVCACVSVCVSVCVCDSSRDEPVVVYLGQRHGAASGVQSSVKWTRRSSPSLLCCIFVRPQSLVLMISPAAFCPPLTTQQSRCESIGRCPHRRCATRHPAHRGKKNKCQLRLGGGYQWNYAALIATGQTHRRGFPNKSGCLCLWTVAGWTLRLNSPLLFNF